MYLLELFSEIIFLEVSEIGFKNSSSQSLDFCVEVVPKLSFFDEETMWVHLGAAMRKQSIIYFWVVHIMEAFEIIL